MKHDRFTGASNAPSTVNARPGEPPAHARPRAHDTLALAASAAGTITHTDASGDGQSAVDVGADLPPRDSRRYELRDRHGQGGLGRITIAYDRDLGRIVAVKELLRPSHRAEARFIREAKITARLEHPAIVPVHDAGRWPTGEAFYTMKLVAGRSLKELLATKESLAERLSLLPNLLAVADAVAYAHSKGIIHRDLKPANVIVGEYGETVVIDWGLAKDLADSAPDPDAGPYRAPVEAGLTAFGEVVGTPAYMSPEQACGKPVGPATDVYALGAMLYEILAGHRPYASDGSTTPTDLLDAVRRGPPARLAGAHTPAELAAIVDRAMDREPTRRYRTAAELADELRRYQQGHLVQAHRYSTRHLLVHWLRRHRTTTTIAAAVLLTSAIAALVSFHRIADARDRAELALAQVRTERNRLILERASGLLDTDPTAALHQVAAYPDDGDDWLAVRDLAADAVSRGIARRVLQHDGLQTRAFQLRPTEPRIIAGEQGRRIRAWDTTARTSAVLTEELNDYGWFEVSPDGDWLAYEDAGGDFIVQQLPGGPRQSFAQPGGSFREFEFAPGGDEFLLARASGRLERWRFGSEHRWRLVEAVDAAPIFSMTWPTELDGPVACHADERVRRWSTGDGSLRAVPLDMSCVPAPRRAPIVSTTSGTVMSLHPPSTARISRPEGGSFDIQLEAFTIAFGYLSPAGTLALLTDSEGQFRLWDLESRAEVLRDSLPAQVTAAQISERYPGVIIGDREGNLRFIDIAERRTYPLPGHIGLVAMVAFASESRQLVSVSDGGPLRIWDEPKRVTDSPEPTHSPIIDLVFSPTGTHVATAEESGFVRLLEIATGDVRVVAEHGALVSSVAFSAEGDRLASAGWDGVVRIWDMTSETSRSYAGANTHLRDVALSPDGHRVAAAGADGSLKQWDVASATSERLELHDEAVQRLAFVGTGSHLITASKDGAAKMVAPGQRGVKTLAARASSAHRLAVSAAHAAFGYGDGHVVVVALNTAERVADLPGEGTVAALAFSPTGRYLAASHLNGPVRVHDLQTGSVSDYRAFAATAPGLAFSPDGETLAMAGEDGTVRLLSLETGRATILRGHLTYVQAIAYSSDGRLLATGDFDGVVRLWDVHELPAGPTPAPSQFRHWLTQTAHLPKTPHDQQD